MYFFFCRFIIFLLNSFDIKESWIGNDFFLLCWMIIAAAAWHEWVTQTNSTNTQMLHTLFSNAAEWKCFLSLSRHLSEFNWWISCRFSRTMKMEYSVANCNLRMSAIGDGKIICPSFKVRIHLFLFTGTIPKHEIIVTEAFRVRHRSAGEKIRWLMRLVWMSHYPLIESVVVTVIASQESG